MTGAKRTIVSAEERLAEEINNLRREMRSAMSQPFIAPVLESDPPESDPTNVWILPDGRMRGRYLNAAGTAYVYREWVSSLSTGGQTSATPTGSLPAQPTTHEQSWSATWSASYRLDDSKRTDYPDRLFHGQDVGDEVNQRQRALVGFDYAAIAAELAGSTVKKVRLEYTELDAYLASVYVYYGIHNEAAEPATWPTIPRRMLVKHQFTPPQTRIVNLGIQFGTEIRDGNGKGLAIEAPNNSPDFYGYGAGVGSPYPVPRLIIEYVK